MGGRRNARARLAALAAAGLALGLPAPAHGIDPADSPGRAGDHEALVAGAEGQHHHWQRGEVRSFVAVTFDLGFAYLRPTLALGYGQPHYQWIGVEGYSGVSSGGLAEYIGLQGALPFLSARLGLRYQVPFSQYYLTPRPSYTQEDVDVDQHGRGRYLALEAEISGSVAIPTGKLVGVATGYQVLGAPSDLYLFEESLKAVIAPPTLWRARLGYLASLGFWDHDPDALALGAAAELLHNPGRTAVTVRVGPLLYVPLTYHLEAVGAVMLVVHSPDQLGLDGANIGKLGLRYSWASGEPAPGFP